MDDEPNQLQVPKELLTEIEALILSGHTVEAIKRLRAGTDLDLAAAKRWVEAWIAAHLRPRRQH